MSVKKKGQIHINTGKGKGKTTAALGMAVRAAGHGQKVLILQFIKGTWETGESKFMKRLAPEIEMMQLGKGFLKIEDGKIKVNPVLLREDELLTVSTVMTYYDVVGQQHTLEVPAGALSLSFCQVPLILLPGDESSIEIELLNGVTKTVSSNNLNVELSNSIFSRDGTVQKITVKLVRDD